MFQILLVNTNWKNTDHQFSTGKDEIFPSVEKINYIKCSFQTNGPKSFKNRKKN